MAGGSRLRVATCILGALALVTALLLTGGAAQHPASQPHGATATLTAYQHSMTRADAGTQCWHAYHNATVTGDPTVAALGAPGLALSYTDLGTLHMQAYVCTNGTSAWIDPNFNGGQPQCWTDQGLSISANVTACEVRPWGNGEQLFARMHTELQAGWIINFNVLNTDDNLSWDIFPGASSETNVGSNSSTFWAITYTDCNNNFCPVPIV